MPLSIRTAVHFVIVLLTGYICFGYFIARAVDNLNLAREEELKAITTRQNLLRRLPKDSIFKMMGRLNRSKYRQESEFNLPLTDSETGEMPEQSTPESAPDYLSITTQHFKIYGYNSELLKFVGTRIEKYYENIVSDTGLFESKALPDMIRIDILRDKEEYVNKTGRPEWSAGSINDEEGSICTYEGPHLKRTIPHELTHLAVGRYLGRKADRDDIRWINEGLAVYESEKGDESYRNTVMKYLKEKIAGEDSGRVENRAYMAFDENASGETVNLWYARAGGLVGFLLTEIGSERFTGFMRQLKEYDTVKEAFSSSYAGVFSDLYDMDRQFRQYLDKTTP